MQSINTNLASLRAQHAVAGAERGLSKTMRELATGTRINSAADDAAGSAISNRMTAQIRGLDQALRNISDASSMLQTAEGATLEITNMLQRMRELTVQSLSGTLADEDRQSVDQEFQQLKQQIDHIANTTLWNGSELLLNLQQQAYDSATPAQISGQGELDTRTPASGTYDLYVNGVKVSIPFVQNELPDARLGKIISAIQAGRAQHGVVADLSGDGSVTLSTPDGRDLSVWYDSSIDGLSAASFGLGRQGGVAQVNEISIIDAATGPLTEDRQDSYVQYSVPGSASLSLPRVSQPDTTAGQLSVVGSTVYRGLGSSAQALGVIDSVKNGQAGQPLRINLLAPFVNGSFEAGVVGSSSVPGWDLYAERIKLDGSQTIAGYPTPIDNRPESTSYQENVASPYTAQLSNASVAPGSTKSIMLKSDNLVVDRFGVSHGPYLVSDPLYIPSGESVAFKWRATGDIDAFDVYAYLLDVDTGDTIPLLNRTGATLSDSTSWVTATSPVTTAGNYRFVFVSGSYDLTGGRATGATLYLDDVQVSGNPPSQKPSSAELDQLYQKVQIGTGQASLEASFNLQGTTLASGPSTSARDALSRLKGQIDNLQAQGQLRGISAELVQDKLRLSSLYPGESMSVTQLSVSNPSYSAEVSLKQAAQPGVEMATGIPEATALSTGAAVVHGDPADEELLASAGKLQFQIGANQDDLVEFRLGDFTGERGILDELTWDTSNRRLARAQVVSQALGQSLVNEVGQPRSQIDNTEGATRTLALLDRALQNVDARRAMLGGAMNRLLSAGNNVSVAMVNQSESRSRMSDSDYASSASDLAKNQIIQNAASAVLAQANMSSKDILRLLDF